MTCFGSTENALNPNTKETKPLCNIFRVGLVKIKINLMKTYDLTSSLMKLKWVALVNAVPHDIKNSPLIVALSTSASRTERCKNLLTTYMN
jgi:hypothetical protein